MPAACGLLRIPFHNTNIEAVKGLDINLLMCSFVHTLPETGTKELMMLLNSIYFVAMWFTFNGNKQKSCIQPIVRKKIK